MKLTAILFVFLAVILDGGSRPDPALSAEATEPVVEIVFRSPYMREENQIYARITSAEHIVRLRTILSAAKPCDRAKFTSPIIRIELDPGDREILDKDVYDVLRYVSGDYLVITRCGTLYEVPVAAIRAWCLSCSLDYDTVFIIGSRAKPNIKIGKKPNQALQNNDHVCHELCFRTPRASHGRG